MNNYKFEILKESAESCDEYENHSHEIIADGIKVAFLLCI